MPTDVEKLRAELSSFLKTHLPQELYDQAIDLVTQLELEVRLSEDGGFTISTERGESPTRKASDSWYGDPEGG